jgi:uncharacterized protein YbaP (TraB family)
MIWRPLALALTTASIAFAAAPAPTPAPAPTLPVQDWTNIESVTVTAPPPGPALWHIQKGNSDVWILATVGPLPKGLTWDSSEVAGLMKGANAVLLPPRGKVGFFEGSWFLLTSLSTLEQPDGTTLESTLPEPLKSRFIATRKRIDEDADRYDSYLGGVAALRLESDYWDHAKLTPYEPQNTIEHLASHAGASARPVAEYPAMSVVKDVPKMSPQAHLRCMEYAIGDIEGQEAHAVAAAQAWATGNLAVVKANYVETKLDDCFQQNNAYAALRETAIRDMTNAIVAALNKPGRTVVAMPMGFLLRKGAVLERLEAAGLTVQGPPGG